ncbi:MAG: hypothetical protein JNM81_12130 [Rhodospirillaceae bacterium]|nr:hypothetical protein [Rhodospirillaceae bacterium]
MDAGVVLALISGIAMLALIVGRERSSQRSKMLLGGIAVAAGIVAISLVAEKF